MSTPRGPDLRELIADGRVHVLDGAMGTVLYGRGVFVNVCYDALNLQQPRMVEEVHRDYLRAGAEVLETNTFGANPVKLSSHGLEERTEEINAAAVSLARRAARGRAAVVGAVGPLGIRIEPFGPTAREEAESYFGRQVRGLLDGGVDGFILETFSDLDEMEAAYRAVRSISDLPVFAQVTIGQDGRTAYGSSIEAVVREASRWGADVVGLNCSVGPADMLDALERMARFTDVPLSAQPNAGLPRTVGDRKIYLASPEYMAQYARRLIAAGARFVGGCCGTTPEHIRRIREQVAGARPLRLSLAAVEDPGAEPPGARDPVPLAERSEWGAKLAAGRPVVSAELVPPRWWDTSEMVGDARRLREAGVDAVSVLDNPRAQSRMGALPAALILQEQVGVETVLHYTCRNRNMLSMVSDLLGAAAGGVRNLLLVTGDPPATGPYPDATQVFDIDSVGLTNIVRRLNRGLDPGGNPVGEPTRFVIGVAVNQGAPEPEQEAERFYWKVDAGAEFAVTQPVFDAEQLHRFLERVSEWRIPVVAGIWCLTSLRNAEFLAHEVPGVHVPEAVMERMRRADERGPEHAVHEGVAIAAEAAEALGGTVQGLQVSAPRGNVGAVVEVLERVEATSRREARSGA